VFEIDMMKIVRHVPLVPSDTPKYTTFVLNEVSYHMLFRNYII